MRTYLFEGVQHAGIPLNWGKFLVGVPDMEWTARSEIDPENPEPLLAQLGWTPGHVWVCDLATGEGAFFRHGGSARADLERHRIWVCPLFEEFLKWLYKQNIEALHLLPRIIELPDAQFSINGYRRLGPHDVSFTLRKGDLVTVEWGGEPRMVMCEAITEDGAMIRNLTAEEVERLGLEDDKEGTETVTFTFPGGTQVTVGPGGQVVTETEAPALTIPDLMTAEQPQADDQETVTAEAVGKEETVTIAAAEETAPADDKKPGKRD